MKTTLALILIAGSVLAADVTVGPYTVTIPNADIDARVKPFLTAEPDRQVIQTNITVEAVEPPIPEAEWDLELDPNAEIVGGFVVAYTNISTRWVDDPLMDLIGDETAQELNQKLRVKLEWIVGEQVEAKLNQQELTYGSEKAVNAVHAAWQATNKVFAIEVSP